jgi:methyl-accepting chemotaxis protein
MRNISIIGKFLLILSGFGLFTLAVSVFVCSQMWKIDSGYTALGAGPEAAAVHVAQANRQLTAMHRSIADLMISNTDAGNQAAYADLQAARKGFSDDMDAAAKA